MLKVKGFTTDELNGFLDEGTEVSGEIRFRNMLRVDGLVRGRIVSEHTLIVGETGDVEAEIDCGTASIRGKVKGNIRCKKKIELLSGADVRASLNAPALSIEEGALFQGDCEMKNASVEAKDEPVAAERKGVVKNGGNPSQKR
ncbi:MAG: polymer-forming cytoskeletal protein [Vicinamibacteria bacterium]|nr:polymer-forming cytoskeletal protein [Vicinamibacteria bacterium]